MPRYVHSRGMAQGIVRDRPSYRTGVQVPVFPSDPTGDAIEGHIRVPLKWTRTKPFTNERHEFTQYIASSIRKWVEWREHNGWRLNSKPKVRGPFDAPTENAQAEKPDWAIYEVTAKFLPTVHMSLGIDDAHELELRARRFGVDTSKPKPTSTPMETGKDRIVDNRPFEDSMVIAERNRQTYGVKREDYIIGDLSEPWGKEK